MAFRATLLAALFACQSAPASPPAQASAPPQQAAVPKQPAADTDAGALVPTVDGQALVTPIVISGCLESELRKRGLNEYGDQPHTMYPGGTPLFNEATGKRIDRTAYVYAHHPEIAAACSASDAGP